MLNIALVRRELDRVKSMPPERVAASSVAARRLCDRIRRASEEADSDATPNPPTTTR